MPVLCRSLWFFHALHPWASSYMRMERGPRESKTIRSESNLITGSARGAAVDLVHLVYQVCLVRPKKRGKPHKSNNGVERTNYRPQLGWNRDSTEPPRKDRFDSALRLVICEALGRKSLN